MTTNRACYGCDKLNDRLMRHAHRVLDNTTPQNLGCNLLLIGKAAIKPINQDVRVNESGPARRGPLFSNPCGSSPTLVARRSFLLLRPTLTLALGSLIEPTEPLLSIFR